jgi:hypothetical protein
MLIAVDVLDLDGGSVSASELQVLENVMLW